MRKVQVKAPSFPEAPTERPLAVEGGRAWQVLCGDAEHWRCGIYSPSLTRVEDCVEFERHTCPELFVLLSGEISLALAEAGGVRVLPLQAGQPVLVTAPHSGFCPRGPHTGRAMVVERDLFETEYRAATDW